MSTRPDSSSASSAVLPAICDNDIPETDVADGYPDAAADAAATDAAIAYARLEQMLGHHGRAVVEPGVDEAFVARVMGALPAPGVVAGKEIAPPPHRGWAFFTLQRSALIAIQAAACSVTVLTVGRGSISEILLAALATVAPSACPARLDRRHVLALGLGLLGLVLVETLAGRLFHGPVRLAAAGACLIAGSVVLIASAFGRGRSHACALPHATDPRLTSEHLIHRCLAMAAILGGICLEHI